MRKVRRRLASVQARGPIYGSLRWDAAFTFVDIDDPRGSERNYNASLGLDWNPRAALDVPAALVPQPHPARARQRALPLHSRGFGAAQRALRGQLRDAVPARGRRALREADACWAACSSTRTATARARRTSEAPRACRWCSTSACPRSRTTTGASSSPSCPRATIASASSSSACRCPGGCSTTAPRELRVDVRGESRMDFGLTRIGP